MKRAKVSDFAASAGKAQHLPPQEPLTHIFRDLSFIRGIDGRCALRVQASPQWASLLGHSVVVGNSGAKLRDYFAKEFASSVASSAASRQGNYDEANDKGGSTRQCIMVWAGL